MLTASIISTTERKGKREIEKEKKKDETYKFQVVRVGTTTTHCREVLLCTESELLFCMCGVCDDR
jgi:hypothetical protein